jgi:hypothetical protein
LAATAATGAVGISVRSGYKVADHRAGGAAALQGRASRIISRAARRAGPELIKRARPAAFFQRTTAWYAAQRRHYARPHRRR